MRLQKGLDITRESWQVLRKDRELLSFRVFSALAVTLIVVTIVSAAFLIPRFGQWASAMLHGERADSFGEQVLGIACIFAIYFVEWSIAIYFNSALVGCPNSLFRRRSNDQRRLPHCHKTLATDSCMGTIHFSRRHDSLRDRAKTWLVGKNRPSICRVVMGSCDIFCGASARGGRGRTNHCCQKVSRFAEKNVGRGPDRKYCDSSRLMGRLHYS